MHPVHLGQRLIITAVVVIWTLARGVEAQLVNKFDVCRDNTKAILNGTLTLGDLNQITIRERGFIYDGPVRGLNPMYPRDKILTLTYPGRLPNDP